MRLRFDFTSLFRGFAIIAGVLMLFCLSEAVQADDGIFPAVPAARPFIDFDGKGFLLNGKREFLASGSLHYPRLPRALWRDRLLRIKRAGFNVIQTYVFWNLHEPQEGKWDFSGDKDLDAFLKLIKELGMYAVVRPGPYVCAEWDSGGYPVWLRFKPGIRVREDNAPYEAAVDRYFEKVMPIIAANQIHKGGAVIMVQLENEHPQGWGKEMPNGYFKHLRDKALALGLEVPYFFSGLHHGSDPAGKGPWDSKGRENPWYSTEFWPGWYDIYGALDNNRFLQFVRGNWKILAYGGNGYNYYMLYGGTDFDTWNDNEVASCYDYGAAVGQGGDLRPIYYAFKHAALFARSFPEILENSENATEEFKEAATTSLVRTTARKSPAGTILFLDNNSRGAVETQIKSDKGVFPAKPVTIQPGEIRPFVQNARLLPTVTVENCSARILGIARQGDTTTLVLFGPGGGPDQYKQAQVTNRIENINEKEFELNLLVDADGAVILPGDSLNAGGSNLIRDTANPHRLSLKAEYPPDQIVNTYGITLGGKKIRILVMSATKAAKTWFIEQDGKTWIVCGLDYAGDVDIKAGKLQINAESATLRYLSRPVLTMVGRTYLFGPEGEAQSLRILDADARRLIGGHERPDGEDEKLFAPPTLSEWEMRQGDAEAKTDYFAGKWKFSLTPAAMGADGDISAYAWYRANVRVEKAGNYTVGFSDAGDWLTLFVNGDRAGSSRVQERFDHPVARNFPVALKAGENSLAVLAAHNGRHKLFNHLGPINSIDAKGISGPVSISKEQSSSVTVTQWQWRAASADDSKADKAPSNTALKDGDWKEAKIGEDVFQRKKGFVWYHTALENVPGPHRRLYFEGVDDNAVVFLNGKRVGAHKGYGIPFDLKLDGAWHEGGPNDLFVLVENTDGPGGIDRSVTVVSNPAEDGTPIQGWRMRGGLSDPTSERGWQPFQNEKATEAPTFYRAEFNVSLPAAIGPHPVLRLTTRGLSRGFVWLNGHNLGRYPEKTPAPGIYLPECWLKNGKNSLVIFDEEGNSPAQSRLTVESESSRYAFSLESVAAKAE